MALLVSGTVCEIREVVLRDKPAEMLAASPKGTVPVLVTPDGSVIDESLEIMRWALSRNDPEDWLAGDDVALIAANDGAFKHHLDRYKYPERHGSETLEHRERGAGILATLEDRLVANAYLAGDRRTLADIAIFPFVRQFAAIDRAWFDALSLPGVHRWLTTLTASPLFEAAMIRLPQWRAGDAPILFPGEGRGPVTQAPAS